MVWIATTDDEVSKNIWRATSERRMAILSIDQIKQLRMSSRSACRLSSESTHPPDNFATGVAFDQVGGQNRPGRKHSLGWQNDFLDYLD
jgi:hypothetical protein